MSGLVTGIVLDRYPGRGGERLVAVALADNAHRDGTHIFPSVAEVADRTKLSRRTVQMHLASMVASGWLILTHKSTGRRGDTNEYRISPEWLAGGECIPPVAPVLRTNAKKPWGAEIAPHAAVDNATAWGANHDSMGCNLTHDGVQPAAPKPSGTVKEPSPQPPAEAGGAGGFDAIAAGYPRRARIEAARRVWAKLLPDATLQAEISRALQAWRRSAEWQREEGRFIPTLSDFLRNQRWLDAPGIAGTPATPAVALPKEPQDSRSPEQREADRQRAVKARERADELLRQAGLRKVVSA